MTTIRLHNSLTRTKEEFTPLDPKNVRMYVCGPTVYDRAHLGNARPVLVFDVLYRLLRHVYGENHVTYVRNFTDVDDKINAKAAETGRDIRDITDETIGWYHADMGAIGALRPTHEPRATEYIGPMIEMIEGLIAKGHAYAAEGHVLFRVRSFADYGRLSGRSVDDMIAGARVEVAPFKEDAMDFVLWKPSDEGQPGWDSPWGRGRPGWHIECSAMADRLLWDAMKDRLSPEALAAPHVFDIHGGGLDLQFPHHENELAQSCCAHHGGEVDPEAGFARYWMHNEMLQVEGKKMSKSLGNFFTVRDLLDQGVPGEVIRFVMLSTHYRKPMDWTKEKAREATKTLKNWYAKTDGVEPNWALIDIVSMHLSDDLNTHAALSEIHFWADSVSEESAGHLKAAMILLGFPTAEQLDWWRVKQSSVPGISYSGFSTPEVDVLFDLLRRWHGLRMAKQYQEADALRKGIESAGVVVRATPDGPFGDIPDVLDFDPAKLEALK